MNLDNTPKTLIHSLVSLTTKFSKCQNYSYFIFLEFPFLLLFSIIFIPIDGAKSLAGWYIAWSRYTAAAVFLLFIYLSDAQLNLWPLYFNFNTYNFLVLSLSRSHKHTHTHTHINTTKLKTVKKKKKLVHHVFLIDATGCVNVLQIR